MKRHHFETVESEIRKEKAEALGKAGERLERAIQDLEAFRQQLRNLVGAGAAPVPDGWDRCPADLEQKLTEYARPDEQARQLRHALIIQREAVGPWKHDDVDRQYPLPEPLTLPKTTRLKGAR